MKIAFLLYPTSRLKIQEDTSFWIMHELVRRGHRVFYFESRHLLWSEGSPRAFLTPAKLDVKKGYLPSWPEKASTDLGSFDSIFIRKEPPFDNEYLYSLQLLDNIKDRVFILNDPQGIAMSNEKLFILSFKNRIPESLVTEDPARARAFIRTLRGKVVVKALHEKGGKGIFSTFPGDENLPSILESATHEGRTKVLVQRFIPARRFGDKRILILDGEIIGAFLRKPSGDDFRANLSLGGSLHRAGVTTEDRKLVEEMAPELAKRGLWFVGIDVIGRYLTEINVTSPAGIPDIHLLEKKRLEKKVADFIESRVV